MISENVYSLETETERNRADQDRFFALKPHHANYVLPAVFIREPNQTPFNGVYSEPIDHTELQFQISIKADILTDILWGRGQLVGAYTNRSFWQAYNTQNSRPFRETNHEPEVFLNIRSDLQLWGFRNPSNSIGVNHQSNGRSVELSRSWNRVTFETVWARGNFTFVLRPWYRIPEEEDEFEGDPAGDDNPDITDYLGNFDLRTVYKRGNQSLDLMIRNNLDSKNYGAVELGWSFPISSGIDGYIKYFNGYGESLIDYDAKTESLGFGIKFN